MNKHNSLIATTLTALTLSTGCATVFKSKQSTVRVTSQTPGAEVVVNGKPAGVTPTSVPLSNKESHVIVVKRDGQEETCRLQSSASTGWIILDIVTAGGWLIDLVTDNWNSLDKSECNAAI